MKTQTIDWKQLEGHVERLAEKIKNSMGKKVTGVFGLPRGGLVPAVMLSHKLDIPLLLAPCKNCVVVDDIADTGTSLEHYAEKGFRIATIWYKAKSSSVVPDFYAVKELKPKDESPWIVFPWETPPTSVK